jgi:predicted RNA-binding protein with PIN domain
MPYLIDGHNLIPKIGLNLGDPQVEEKLVELLQTFCQLRQTQVEVFFDGGKSGQPAQRKYGRVMAHFVRQGKGANAADAAIESRLVKLGRSARNWSVVSSDQRVKAAAREVHARVLSSEEFTRLVADARFNKSIKNMEEANLSSDDLSEWLDLFNNKREE